MMSYKNLSNISEYSFMEITYILFTFIYKFYFLPTSFSPSPSLFPLFTSLFFLPSRLSEALYPMPGTLSLSGDEIVKTSPPLSSRESLTVLHQTHQKETPRLGFMGK